MVTFFANGEIIKHPDVSNIKRRISERNDAENRCKYGTDESYCPAWFDFRLKDDRVQAMSCYGRCFLAGSELCPNSKKRKETGKMTKHFKIDHPQYRKLSSAAHVLIKTSEYKVLFLTLTFPKYKKQLNEKTANVLFSKFIENLRESYNCTGYVGVRERGSARGRIHYHVLVSLPFVDFRRLNTYWNSVISDYCEYSANAVQTDKKTRFIVNPVRAVKYICKYFSKAKGAVSDSRLYFISNNLLSEDVYNTETGEFLRRRSRIKETLPNNLVLSDVLRGFKSIYIKDTSEYTTSFLITDSKELMRFFNEYLYSLLGISCDNVVKVHFSD